MTDGTSQGLFIVVAIVIFGIFTLMAYILFEDTLSPALASMFGESTEKYTESGERHYDSYFEYEYIKNGTEVRLLNYTGHLEGVTDVVIPSHIYNTPVTTIAHNSFNKRGLTSIVFPNTLEVIENGNHLDYSNSTGAFANNELVSLTIPGNLVFIGVDTFSGNPLTNGVVFDDGKDIVIDSYAFWNTGIVSITIPERVKSVQGAIFEDSKKLKSVTFEGNNRKGGFGDFLFQDTGLEGVFKVPEGFTRIGMRALSATNITELHIPSTVTELGDDIVLFSTYLEKIYIPEHLRSYVESNPNTLRKDYSYSNSTEFIYY